MATSTARALGRKEFSLLVDLGTIVVPQNYVHEICLADFRVRNRATWFYIWDAGVSDKNFGHPSRMLKSGDVLKVRAYVVAHPGRVQFYQCAQFLLAKNAVYPGVQGVTVIFDQIKELLPKGYVYYSLECEKWRLWKDAEGKRRVPGLLVSKHGDYSFRLGRYHKPLRNHHAFLCFHEVQHGSWISS